MEELMIIYHEKSENGMLSDDFGLCPKCSWFPAKSENMQGLDHEIDENMEYYFDRMQQVKILLGDLRDNLTGAYYLIIECEECKTKYACQMN